MEMKKKPDYKKDPRFQALQNAFGKKFKLLEEDPEWKEPEERKKKQKRNIEDLDNELLDDLTKGKR